MSMVNENEGRKPFESGDSRISWRVIVGIVVAALSLVFILQNTEKVKIDFLFVTFDVGMWLGLLVAFVLGMLLGWGLQVAWRRRKRTRAAAKSKKN